jgi:hypothetical protein
MFQMLNERVGTSNGLIVICVGNFLSNLTTVRFQEGLISIKGALLCLQKLAPACGADAVRHVVKVEEDGLVTVLIRNNGDSRAMFVAGSRRKQ